MHSFKKNSPYKRPYSSLLRKKAFKALLTASGIGCIFVLKSTLKQDKVWKTKLSRATQMESFCILQLRDELTRIKQKYKSSPSNDTMMSVDTKKVVLKIQITTGMRNAPKWFTLCTSRHPNTNWKIVLEKKDVKSCWRVPITKLQKFIQLKFSGGNDREHHLRQIELMFEVEDVETREIALRSMEERSTKRNNNTHMKRKDPTQKKLSNSSTDYDESIPKSLHDSIANSHESSIHDSRANSIHESSDSLEINEALPHDHPLEVVRNHSSHNYSQHRKEYSDASSEDYKLQPSQNPHVLRSHVMDKHSQGYQSVTLSPQKESRDERLAEGLKKIQEIQAISQSSLSTVQKALDKQDITIAQSNHDLESFLDSIQFSIQKMNQETRNDIKMLENVNRYLALERRDSLAFDEVKELRNLLLLESMRKKEKTKPKNDAWEEKINSDINNLEKRLRDDVLRSRYEFNQSPNLSPVPRKEFQGESSSQDEGFSSDEHLKPGKHVDNHKYQSQRGLYDVDSLEPKMEREEDQFASIQTPNSIGEARQTIELLLAQASTISSDSFIDHLLILKETLPQTSIFQPEFQHLNQQSDDYLKLYLLDELEKMQLQNLVTDPIRRLVALHLKKRIPRQLDDDAVSDALSVVSVNDNFVTE